MWWVKFSELSDKAQEGLQECGRWSLVSELSDKAQEGLQEYGEWSLVNSVTKHRKACRNVVGEV